MCAKLRVVRDDEEEPIESYTKAVESGTVATLPYERLMIYYRKQKMYVEELNVINKGIATLKNFYKNQQSQTLKKKINSSVKALSKKIGKSTGLIDKKGNDVYLPEPIPKWMKRKTVVETKLKKQKRLPRK